MDGVICASKRWKEREREKDRQIDSSPSLISPSSCHIFIFILSLSFFLFHLPVVLSTFIFLSRVISCIRVDYVC